MTFQPWIDMLLLGLIPLGIYVFLWAIRRAVRRDRGEDEW